MAAIPDTISAPAKLESLPLLLGFVDSCAERQGFGPERMREIELVMEEILVNIFSYAYPEGAGDVEIACQGAEAGKLRIEVCDRGVPFDVLDRTDPDLEADIDERRIGGLGIFFVKQLVQDIQYRRAGEKNVLTLSVDSAPANL